MRSTSLRLLAAVERHPRAALAGFLAFHALLWTALPAALYGNLPLDLIEALTYGREWQLGYDKLPPLPWWMVEVAYRVVGHDFAYYLLAQISVVVAFLAVFALGQRLVGALRALVSLLIIDGLHYFNFTAAKFNHDVAQLPFWAIAGWAYYRALRGGALRHWALLGLAVGIALWAKYFVVVLAAPLALFLLFDREARRNWTTPGPYVAMAVTLVVVAPHLVWLVTHHFLPLRYAEIRAAPSRGLIDHVLHPAAFAISQLFFLLPALAIAAPLVWRSRAHEPAAADTYDRRIVALLAFGPMATVLALSGLSGRGTIAMWGYPLWLFLGLLIVLAAEPALDRIRLARVTGIWAAITAALAGAFVFDYAVLPPIDGRYRAALYPGDALAREIARRFQAETGTPLTYVIAFMWEGGNISHYAREHPRVLIDGQPWRAPWIDLKDFLRHGAAVVWIGSDRPEPVPWEFGPMAGDAVVEPSFALPYRYGPLTLHVHWALVPAVK